MNIKEIKEMIALMNENGLLELEIEKEGMRIRLKKTASGQVEMSGTMPGERQAVSESANRQVVPLQQAGNVSTVEIKAPMVGSFYRAPSPEAAPYVEVGQIIEPGQVICVIEAMKLMNEIKAEVKGKILEVLVDNSEPLEFGQPMFLIEPL